MIDWSAFLIVALVSWVAALCIVTAYSFGVRLLAVARDEDSNTPVNKFGAYLCFGVCGVIVLFGVVLIVPQLSRAILGA